MAFPVARQHSGLSVGFFAVSKSRLNWTGCPYSSNIQIIKCHFNQKNSKASYVGLHLCSQSFFIGESYLECRRQLKWSYQGKGLSFLIQATVEGGASDTPDGSKAIEVDNIEVETSIYKQSNCIDDIVSLRAALAAAEAKISAAEREKAEALEALSKAEAKQQDYAERIVQTTESAMRDIESARAEFDEDMERMLEGKLAVVSELILTKQDAINLAVKVEKLAESAIQVATGNIAKEAALMIAGAETAAAEASAKVEERIQIAVIDASNSILGESRNGIEKSLFALEASKDKAQKTEAALFQKMQILDNLALKEASALGSQRDVSILQHKIWAVNNENNQLSAEIKGLMERAKVAEEHAAAANAALLQCQEEARKNAQEYEEKARKALDDLKNAGKVQLEAVRISFRAGIENIQTTAHSVHRSGKAQEEADVRRCEALERSLAAAQATADSWKEHSLVVEDVFRKVKEQGIETVEGGETLEGILNGGRIAMFLCSDSRRKDLLASGPRTETPGWMLRRAKGSLQGLPPEKRSQVGIEPEAHLKLPTPEDVWSIVSAKMKEDVFTKQAAEKEAMDKQRIALECALERKMVRKSKEAEMKIEPGTGSGHEIVFQGFNWESWRRNYYLELAPKAADLANCGITTIWFPPPMQSITPQGYMPGDLYDLNSAYGTVEELKSCIEEMHNHDLMVLGDVILNHRCAQKQSPNGVWNIFGGKLAWGPEAIARDDPSFQGRGNLSSGEHFHAAPHIDHSQEFVRRDIKGWLNWLRKEIGFDGWRLDFVRGFWAGYVKEYIEATDPAFVVGEYWDSLAYEGGNVCYNQDAHRQRIVNWINATGGTSSAFDVTTKGILHAALHNEYWRLIDPQGKPPGVMGWWPSRAVTFLENHDTGSTQGHWPFPREKLVQGYAYILTHPGTPVIFYDHFYDFGLRDAISELIAVRTQTGIHCCSPIRIYEATNQGYAAQIGDSLIMKIGPSDWNPLRKNNLAGNWCRVVDKGLDYQIWRKT